MNVVQIDWKGDEADLFVMGFIPYKDTPTFEIVQLEGGGWRAFQYLKVNEDLSDMKLGDFRTLNQAQTACGKQLV